MASDATTAAWFVDKMINARVQGANEAYAAWLASARSHEAEFSTGIDVATLRRDEQDDLAKILRDAGFSVTRMHARDTGKCSDFIICKDKFVVFAAAAAAGAPIPDDDDKILARVAEAKAAYEAWCADASAHEAEFAATVEIADLPRNKQHKMAAFLRGSGFESIRQTGTGRDTLAVSKARPAPPRAIVVGDLPIRVRGAYHAALAFYEDAKPGPHPVSYEVGMTEWSAADRRLLMDALVAKGFTYECKQYIAPNPPRFTATFRKDKPVAAAAAPAAAAAAASAPTPIDDVNEAMITARVKGVNAAYETWLAKSRDLANGFAASIDVDALTDHSRNKLQTILTSAAFGVTRIHARRTGKCTSFDIHRDAPVAAVTGAANPVVITRSQPDAHFWVQMADENDHDDSRRSFQCDRCQVPMSVSSDCRTYEQMTGMFTTLVCPAWMVHRHNPAVYALRKAAEEAAAAAAASGEPSPNKRQRR